MRFALRKIGGRLCSVARTSKPAVIAGVVGLGAVSSFAADLVNVDGTTGEISYDATAVAAPMKTGAVSGTNVGISIGIIFLIAGIIWYAIKRFKK